MSEFEIPENTLAQRIGVSQEKLREIRQNELKKEQDFSLVRVTGQGGRQTRAV